MANYNTIILEQQNGIYRLTLNRPDKLNALNREMYFELGNAIDEIENDSNFRVLIIRGAGRAFCSGGDIKELSTVTKSIEAAQKRLYLSHAIAVRIKTLKQPIIVAINGDAIGGGCSLALNGDLRIASEKARFGVTFIKVGLVPDMGGIYNLPRLVGISKACELAFLGNIIDAQEAERIGLINRVVAADELETVTNEWAAKIAQSSSLAISLIKSALYKGLNMDFISEIDNEINIQTLCLNSHNGKEGLRAFMEKRQPVFNLLNE